MYHYVGQVLTPSTGLATQNISGALSGAYTKKRYFVTANCTIASGVSVSFAAGSVIEFDGDFKFSVIGQLQLNGSSVDRITVKASAANTNNRWRGFLMCTDTNSTTFSGGQTGTTHKFNYVDFYNAEKLQQSGGNYHVIRGAAIFAYLFTTMEVTNCTFNTCKGLDYGGTVYLHGDTGNSLTFTNCSFVNCSAQNDSAACWVLVHGTYTVSGMSYSGSTMGWTDGNAFAYTVNTSTEVFTSGSGDNYGATGQTVYFAASTNAPTPLTSGVAYPMIWLSATTWKLASSYANANAGTAIDITAQASGTKICKLQVDFAWFDATVTVNA